jgi:two-component system chemotaxis response regulator CheB
MAKRHKLKKELLVIGGSAGSLDALLHLLPGLEEEMELAIVIVVHRRGESILTNLLSDRTSREVKEAEEKEIIKAGTIYIAPADYHLMIEKDKTFSLDFSEKVNYSRPAIDVTFETAADAYGAALVGLLLSGANADGSAGLKKIKAAGGYVMVQDPDEAKVAYMPRQALLSLEADAIVKMAAVPAILKNLFL